MGLIRLRAAEIGDESYGDFVTAVPFDYYRKRVAQLGFAGLGRVLDVGCGHGHWTAALAEVNDEVVGIDQSASRIGIAKEVTAGFNNVTLEVGNAYPAPYPDESFDGIFCYGVFMFLDRDKALAEFHRILKPGGRLYVFTAARGWWLKMLRESWRNPALRRSALQGLSTSGVPPHSVTTRQARRLLRDDWTNVHATLEGHLGGDPSQAVYTGRWHGIESVVEFVAERR